MKNLILTLAVAFSAMAINAKTLVVYYSFTNNVTLSSLTCRFRQVPT